MESVAGKVCGNEGAWGVRQAAPSPGPSFSVLLIPALRPEAQSGSPLSSVSPPLSQTLVVLVASAPTADSARPSRWFLSRSRALMLLFILFKRGHEPRAPFNLLSLVLASPCPVDLSTLLLRPRDPRASRTSGMASASAEATHGRPRQRGAFALQLSSPSSKVLPGPEIPRLSLGIRHTSAQRPLASLPPPPTDSKLRVLGIRVQSKSLLRREEQQAQGENRACSLPSCPGGQLVSWGCCSP